MPMSDTDIVERLRWQKRYTKGIVPVTMEDAAKEIERLRAALIAVNAMDPHGFYVAPMGSALRRQVEAALAPRGNDAGQSTLEHR